MLALPNVAAFAAIRAQGCGAANRLTAGLGSMVLISLQQLIEGAILRISSRAWNRRRKVKRSLWEYILRGYEVKPLSI